MGSRAYLLLTLLLYAVGALHSLIHAVSGRRAVPRLTLTATLIGFALHTAALALRWREAGHFPAVGLGDAASFLAWVTVLAFLVGFHATRVEASGLIAYPLSFVLAFVAAFTPPSERPDPVLRSLYLPLHTALAFLGYAALFSAFVMGVLYLVQERELRSRAPGRFYYLIPSLERCDTIGGRSVLGGFGFLSLAIVTGFLWNRTLHGHYWTGDAKEWAALLAWVIYVVLISARARAGWGGRRAAWLGIAGFSIVVFTFIWAATAPVVVAGR
jgi:ABC-type uncharacterized transport system permease subunit